MDSGSVCLLLINICTIRDFLTNIYCIFLISMNIFYSFFGKLSVGSYHKQNKDTNVQIMRERSLEMSRVLLIMHGQVVTEAASLGAGEA